MIENPFGKTSNLEELFKKESPKEESKVETPILAPVLVKIELPVVAPVSVSIPVKTEPVVFKNESEHAKILREHGGLESNIPVNHLYWQTRP
jgi:hypothetical protein